MTLASWLCEQVPVLVFVHCEIFSSFPLQANRSDEIGRFSFPGPNLEQQRASGSVFRNYTITNLCISYMGGLFILEWTSSYVHQFTGNKIIVIYHIYLF